MIGEMLVIAYIVVAIVVGVKVFTKALSWLPETDRVMPLVPTSSSFLWGFLAFIVALLLEGIVLYSLWGSPKALFLLALSVGPIEEGAKLLPYLIKRDRGILYRWNLTIKTALAFGIIEGVLYFLLLLASGNVLGAVIRVIVVMFHVVWTAIALEKALRGSLLVGYLKAAVLHSLYDAPMLIFLSGAGLWIVPVALVGIAVLVYLYTSVDSTFSFAYSFAKRLIEERRIREKLEAELQGEEENEESLGEFTSWP